MIMINQLSKQEFENKYLNVKRLGEVMAKRNRDRIIKELGPTYFQDAGKLSLYEMMMKSAKGGNKQ